MNTVITRNIKTTFYQLMHCYQVNSLQDLFIKSLLNKIGRFTLQRAQVLYSMLIGLFKVITRI